MDHSELEHEHPCVSNRVWRRPRVYCSPRGLFFECSRTVLPHFTWPSFNYKSSALQAHIVIIMTLWHFLCRLYRIQRTNSLSGQIAILETRIGTGDRQRKHDIPHRRIPPPVVYAGRRHYPNFEVVIRHVPNVSSTYLRHGAAPVKYHVARNLFWLPLGLGGIRSSLLPRSADLRKTLGPESKDH